MKEFMVGIVLVWLVCFLVGGIYIACSYFFASYRFKRSMKKYQKDKENQERGMTYD